MAAHTVAHTVTHLVALAREDVHERTDAELDRVAQVAPNNGQEARVAGQGPSHSRVFPRRVCARTVSPLGACEGLWVRSTGTDSVAARCRRTSSAEIQSCTTMKPTPSSCSTSASASISHPAHGGGATAAAAAAGWLAISLRGWSSAWLRRVPFSTLEEGGAYTSSS